MVNSINRRTLRLPQDAACFIEREAEKNMTSGNAEIIRSIRERMLAATGVKFGDQAPAAASNETGSSPAHSTHGR